MALSSSIEYCSDRDVFDVYPQIKSSDTKTRVFNWVVHSGSLYRSDDSGLVTALFKNGQDLGNAQANSGQVTTNDQWFYESSLDAVYYFNNSTSPNDMIMEAGEDSATILQRYRRNASRYVEAKLDSRLSSEVNKDREGNYPYIIKRTASLVCVAMLLKADDPTSNEAEAFMEEAKEYISGLKSGEIQLPASVTGDASYGYIRDVIYTSGKIRPIQTRGMYTGTYDLLKVKIEVGGAIGTAKYSVFEKNSTGLKANQVVASEIINGDYQQCAGGLEIRFAGSTDSTVATANDEWEIEVYGVGEDVRSSNVGNIRMSRGSHFINRRYVKGGYHRVGNRKMRY